MATRAGLTVQEHRRREERGKRTGLLFLLLILLAGARPALAEDERIWAVSADAGTSVDLSMQFVGSGWTRVNAALSLRLGRWVETSLIVGGSVSSRLTGFSASAQAGAPLRFWRLGLLLGWRLGYLALRLADSRGELWTGALQHGPTIELRIPLAAGLELRAAPADVTIFWNQVLMVNWEPRAGLGYVF